MLFEMGDSMYFMLSSGKLPPGGECFLPRALYFKAIHMGVLLLSVECFVAAQCTS